VSSGERSADPFTIGPWVSNRAITDPERVAIVFEGQSMTYWQLNESSTDVARALLSLGMSPGDRVGSLTENRPEHVILLFACAKAGLTLFPMNWRLTNVELVEQLILIEPSILLVSATQRVRAEGMPDPIHTAVLLLEEFCTDAKSSVGVSDLPTVSGDDGLMIIATSGTTGRPKGVLLTHANFFWTNLSLDLVAPITFSDVVLQVLPQFHVGGWNVQPMLAWWKGATVILESSFEPERVLEVVARERVTTMAGVPTTYLMMGTHANFSESDLSSLRYVVVGGASMPQTLLHRWHDKGVAVLQGYGLTEAAPNVFCLGADDAIEHPGSVGHPYPYVDVALVRPGGCLGEDTKQGELWVRGPCLFAGYWRDLEATEAVMKNGWLRTGDVARRDNDGYYRIIGRTKEMFVSGGENVYPVEVENVITAFPGVFSAGVVWVDDPIWGEAGVAFVERAPGALIDLDALSEHCRARLAAYKIPVRFHVVDQLPRSPVGKLNKMALRTSAEAEQG
jgi:fatty-acyl-CoA synthase